jgi:hypothetical protein
MPFRYRGNDLTVGFGTNYYSLQPGTGGFLFRHWMKACPLAISLGASQDAHRILRRQRWPYFDGVKLLCLNKPYDSYPEEPTWKRAAKWIVRQTTRRPIPCYANRIPKPVHDQVQVAEEKRYSDDLLPLQPQFEFRFSPDTDYLNWRYGLDLPFVRYRVFRITARGRNGGYVIFNERPERIIVSQCDAENAVTLAWGVLLALVELTSADNKPRTVTLTCTNSEMEAIYSSFGFKMDAHQPLALTSLNRDIGPMAGSDTSNWLINYDWGDNGLLELIEPPAMPAVPSQLHRADSTQTIFS